MACYETVKKCLPFALNSNLLPRLLLQVVGGNPCYVGEGIARVYALQYQTGNAAFNFDLTNDDGTTKVISKTDRSKGIGTGMPSGVVMTFIGGKGILFIGVGGGVNKIDPNVKQREPKYWKMVF
jgi:hypothetical protein